MAAREPIDLGFGDQVFRIRPLTFKQVEALSTLFATQGDGDDIAARMKLAREAIAIALVRDHAGIDVDELECDLEQLPHHLLAIMRLGGFRHGEAAPGEAPAAAATAAGLTPADA